MNIFIAHINGKTAELTPEESWHCAKVLRFKAGQPVRLIDGKGNFYEATLESIHEKKCTAIITAGPTQQPARPYYLHLAIAPTKNIDRIEWLIEKAVEIGIDEISFLRCKNSERTVIKADRIQKIAESAVKQSLQALLPKINELTDFKNSLDVPHGSGFIAHCEDEEKQPLKNFIKGVSNALVLVGPEGDFTPAEIELAMQKNFKAVSLGENRLRTETAGLYVCSAFALLS